MSLDRAFLERVSASAVKAGLTDIVYGVVNTRVGRLLVAQSEAGVCRVAFEGIPESDVLFDLATSFGPRIVESTEATREAREALESYIEGDLLRFDVPVDFGLVGSSFHRKVLRRLQKVPRGKVMTYGQLAGAIGHPKAARATGTALAQNPIPVIVPCHRVVPSSMKVGNYGGQPWRKEFLLRLEGAEVRL